ncbi:MAG: PHP domain-containing protein [Elusimicrobiota bacterium]
MIRPDKRLSAALVVSLVALSPGIEAPRLFAQALSGVTAVRVVSPVFAVPAAAPTALSGISSFASAPSISLLAPALAAPLSAAAAPAAEGVQASASASAAASSARASLDAAHAELASAYEGDGARSILARVFGEAYGRTNPLIDPRDLGPLLEYDAKTWTSAVSLHAHSRYSDGELSPAELARKLASAGVREVALTDHDNVEGQEEFAREAAALGLKVHTGVELTAGAGIHIVVLDLNVRDAKLAALLRRTDEWRLTRAKAYVSELNARPELRSRGVVLSIEEVLAKTVNGQIERPEIAEVLIDKGLVKTKQEAFEKFIGHDIKIAEVLALEPTPAKVMEAVRSSGGRAFLAHPYTIPAGGPSMRDLLALGLDGIETYRPSAEAAPQEAKKVHDGMTAYLTLAHDLGIAVTPGADFHGPSTPNLNHPVVPMPSSLADQLLAVLSAPNKAAFAAIMARLASTALPAFAPDALIDPSRTYSDARKQAVDIAAARGVPAYQVRFVSATAEMPVRDGGHWRYAFSIPGRRSGRALIYADTSRFLGGALETRTSVYENAPEEASAARPIDAAPFGFQDMTVDPQQALDAARRAAPGLRRNVAVALDYREGPSAGEGDLWYRFYDDAGRAVSVNARTADARVDANPGVK